MIAAILGSSLLAAPAASGGFPRFGAGCTRDDFVSGGSTVRAELCRSKAGGGRAVVVLHGCGGFSTFDHRLVTTLPAYGISTLDVDYVYPRGSHNWPGRQGALGIAHAAAFLKRYLR
jgi:hypothetical protein